MAELALQPRLPVGAIGRKSLGWWGVLTLIATEGSLFAYLLFCYLYYAVQLDRSWMPGPPPSLRLALPNTIILLLSSVAVWAGERGVIRGRRGLHLAGLALALLLGTVFVGVQLLEWHDKPYSFRSGHYASLYFTTTGFHMAHVVLGLVVLLVILIASCLRYYDTRRNAPVLIGSAYWHFVDVVWLFVFTVYYLTPRVM